MRAIQESVAKSRQAALERTLQRQAEEQAAKEVHIGRFETQKKRGRQAENYKDQVLSIGSMLTGTPAEGRLEAEEGATIFKKKFMQKSYGTQQFFGEIVMYSHTLSLFPMTPAGAVFPSKM